MTRNLVARWYGGSDLRLEAENVRPPQADEVLVRIVASGVCGSDVHAVTGTFELWPPPVVLGHEGIGVVEEVGSLVRSVSKGQLVALSTSVSCGSCFFCREGEELLCTNRELHIGSFARYMTVPSVIVFAIPDGVSWKAAVLAEPLACVLHAIDRLDVKPGQLVAVIGGGTIGLLALRVLIASGASVVVSEPKADRRDLAGRMGAHLTVDPTEHDLDIVGFELTGGIGFDRVLEAVGLSATVDSAIAAVRRGGTVVIMGVADRDAEVAIRPYEVYERELTIKGSFIRRFDFQRAVRLVGELNLEHLVTDEFRLERIEEAIESVRIGRGIKTVVVPTEAGK